MEGHASVQIHLRRRRFVVLVLAAAALAAVGTAHGHEEDKGERIAAGLREAPAAYAPVNLELVGRIALGRDLEMSRPVATPQGDLLTADLYVVGSHAYVGSWAHVLHVVDIARPEQMREVARVPMPGPAIDVKIEGNLAVVGVQDRGSDFRVVIVDVADPGNQVILAGYASLDGRVCTTSTCTGNGLPGPFFEPGYHHPGHLRPGQPGRFRALAER